MSRIGMKNKSPKSPLVENPSIPGALAYRIDDAATKLITMIGAGFFNEPRYYSQDVSQYPVFVGINASEGVIVKNSKNKKDLTPQAEEVIKTAIAVANSDNPQDLWIISQWARQELHIRTTPNVLAAVGCANNATKPWARKYISRISQRADEPLQVLAAYLHLYGKPLPNSLRRGLSDSISGKNEWELLRYTSKDGHPSTKDMLLLIDRRASWPVSKELFEYIVNDQIVDPTKTPIAAAVKSFSACKNFDAEAKALAIAGHVTWEMLISKFGSTKDTWEFLIENNLLGYMAMLRNLRNFEQTKISDSHKKLVSDKLVGGVLTSKQLPFRFLAARKNTSENWTASILDSATEIACENIPPCEGKTAVLIDVSGSMEAPISEKSSMTNREAAASLAAMLAKKYGSDNVEIFIFGSTFAPVRFSDKDSVLAIVDKTTNKGVGHGTEPHLVVKHFIDKQMFFDRIVVFSDMQCYESYGYEIGSLQGNIKKYQKQINPNVFIHSIDMAGYGRAQFDPKDKHVQLLGGFSENLFNLFSSFESPERVPTIEELRNRYGK